MKDQFKECATSFVKDGRTGITVFVPPYLNRMIFFVGEDQVILEPDFIDDYYKKYMETGEIPYPKAEEVIVLFSTHIIEDVESCCDKVIVMNEGKICYEGSCEHLVEETERCIQEKKYNRSHKETTLTDGYMCVMKGLISEAAIPWRITAICGEGVDSPYYLNFLIAGMIAWSIGITLAAKRRVV